MRLWQRLFLALAGTGICTVLVYAGWQYRVFSTGFMAFLDASAIARLEPALPVLAQAYADAGDSWQFLRGDDMQLRRIVDQATLRRMPPMGIAPPSAGWPSPPEHGSQARPGPPAGPPRPRDPMDLLSRLRLHDAEGVLVSGHGGGSGRAASAALSRPIVDASGKLIGSLRLEPAPRFDDSIQRSFVQQQQRSAWLVAGLSVLLALLAAWYLSRRLSAPLRSLSVGARALSQGDYTLQLPVRGKDEIAELSGEFNHLATALHAHRQARQQLGADLAHELRTPLTILRGEVQLLQDGVRPLDMQAIDSLEAEIERLSTLVEVLYELALADAHALDYRMEPLNLEPLLRTCGGRWSELMAAAGLALQLQVAPQLWIRGDAGSLERLLDNLLSNALRYTDAPGTVLLWARAEGGLVCVRVADSAPAVPEVLLPRLFERLFRVERSRSRAAGGAGLGLAICQTIASAHCASIRAMPAGLGGVQIEIRFPGLPVAERTA